MKPAPSVNPLSSTEKFPTGRWIHLNSKTKRSILKAPVNDTEGKEKLNARLKALMEKDKVMLFMKGAPDAPRCGFSRKIVNLLRDQNVKYSSFDILSDENVRSGMTSS